MNAQIRPPEASDFAAILHLQSRTLNVTRTADDLARELSGDHVICRVLKFRGNVLGFLNAWVVGETVELTEIAVEPACRNRGYGRALLRWLIDFGMRHGCSRVILEVRAGNVPARGLYESYGFQVDGTRPRYYGNGEDAFLYSLEISSDAELS